MAKARHQAEQYELPMGQHPAMPSVISDLRKIVRRLQGEKLQLQTAVSVITEERNKALEDSKLLRRELVRMINVRVGELSELLRRVPA